MSEPIRISREDLGKPKVDQVLAQEAAFRGAWVDDGGGGEAVGKVKRAAAAGGRGEGVYHMGVAWTAVLGLLGALVAWAPFEPHIIEDPTSPDSESWLVFLMIPAVVAATATFISAGDGLLSRAWERAFRTAIIGLGIGLVGGVVFTFLAEIGYAVGRVGLAVTLTTFDPEAIRSLEDPSETQLPFSVLVGNMSVRAMAWSVFGIPIGLAPGLAQRSRDLVLVGILGGVVGGFLGGFLFDPISQVFPGAGMSRAVGFGFVGLVSGLSIGLVEQLSKDAWLYMEQGPLAGKQFVIYKDPTRIGSSPKCDVYVFKDSEVEPEHAWLRRTGSTHEIEAKGTASIIVNGRRTNRARLEDGDQVKIGRAVFRYYVRKKKKRKPSSSGVR